ncbi:lysine N(6)-hydroxylase/L-ornithine N(5)-oxygenase family protein [Kineosporia babensis]|uniref:L-lysine N6-monooxygenase MbtG n=1 Tax=Kineosporia babensis TaxID=499548 RepID=A0A9X1NIE1_9ACTN|nr:SidA/IucD/PvdA family monooxygenase [Kineosporia babensis]MCD5314341.1 lysine N(6)-hydroxylase/L-ornithine N(5)-oxygenase family protein [Kineosporia babensis]
MSTEAQKSGQKPLDVVGVGFGPSNLGTAIAIHEHNATASAEQRLSAAFAERQDRFGWHRGMLLEGATMQVHYLKDLATLRNPSSQFSFLAYLHEHDRLADFINYRSSYPTRREFHDYLEWAAGRVEKLAAESVDVRYGREVLEVVPVHGDGTVQALDVLLRSGGQVERLRARNVVLACGLVPVMPAGVTMSSRIWHNRDLLFRTGELAGTNPRRFAVVGAGQSAAETAEHLHRTFPEAEVHAVFARYGYSPADDSSFANRIFDPPAVDQFFTAPDEVKGRIVGYHSNTNYSVVDSDLIEKLYRTHYDERVAGAERLKFHNVSEVVEVVEAGDQVKLSVQSNLDGSREVIMVDAVVYATGYRVDDPLELLDDGLAAAVVRDDQGRPAVQRDYRLATTTIGQTPVRAGIYLQGATEHTHGISSTLLSNVAVRSGEIVRSLAEV